MGQIINYTRLTTSDKLDDRFLTCQVYEPADPEQARSGIVFSQIEILNPWFPTSQIGQTVINTLIREYYRGNDSSDLINFEKAVKKVNEALAQIAQNGETEWIGKFSGILALVNGEEIHIAQTGKSHAYLYRGNKVNHVTEGLESTEPPHPLKTFTNLTSGSIQQGDKIVIGNSTLFSVFSPDELKIPVLSYRPTASAIEIARTLKRRGAQNGNAIILELTTKEELANIPPEQKVDTIYLDKSGFDPISMFKSASSAIAPIFGAIADGTKSLAKKTKKSLGPKIKNGLVASRKNIREIAKSATKLSQETREKISPNVPDQTEGSDTDIPNHQTRATQKSPGFAPSIKKQSLKLKNRLRRTLISLGIHSSNKSKTLITLIYIVVAVLILTVSYTLFVRSKKINDRDLSQKTAQITSLSGEASTALSKKDDDTALQKYTEIVNLASSVKGTKYETSVKEIIDKAQSKIKEISKLQSIEPSKEYGISTEVSGLANIDGNLVFYKDPEGIFLKTSSQSDFTLMTGGKLSSIPIASTTIQDKKQAAFLLADSGIVLVDIDKKTGEEQQVNFDGGVRLSEFSQNLYTLDPSSNQIWKITEKDGKYSNSSTYIKDETNISGTVDIAIDGSVYVISEDCNITKFSRGSKSSEFKVDTPGSEILNNCKRVSTNESSGSIFVVVKNDNKARIIEIKKEGGFVAQYDLNKSDGFKEVIIDSKKREATVQSENQIITYKF